MIRRIFFLLSAVLTILSCSLEHYSSKNGAEIRIIVPPAMLEDKAQLTGGPSPLPAIPIPEFFPLRPIRRFLHWAAPRLIFLRHKSSTRPSLRVPLKTPCHRTF